MTFELLRTLKNSYYLTCQSAKLAVDCNSRTSIVAANFVQEMDFCFKRQRRDSPLRLTRMELNNQVRVDSLCIDLGTSELKLVLDVVDVYARMVFSASVKHQIMAVVLDREFMKNNLLHSSQFDQHTEQRVFALFEESKYKDAIVSEISVNKIERSFNAYDPANALKLESRNFRLRVKDELGVEEMVVSLGFANLQPVKPRAISLFKIQNFELNLMTTRAARTKLIKNVAIAFEKCHVNVNMEYVLAMTDEILDCAMITKHYGRKWDAKFSIKDQVKESVIESLSLAFQEAQIIWPMSRSRYCAFRLVDFSTKPVMCPFKNEA